MDSLKKLLEAMKGFHRSINWIDKDNLFQKGDEEAYGRYVKSWYRERQSASVFKETLDKTEIKNPWNTQRYSSIYQWITDP